jgi:hypothetical protein
MRKSYENNNGQHNNGMHPTANSAAFIRQLEGLFQCLRGG